MPKTGRFRRLSLLLVLLSLAFSAVSSDAIGDRYCRACHAALTTAFSDDVHARVINRADPAHRCEACHGPGKSHALSLRPERIVNPANDEGASPICLTCHQDMLTTPHWMSERRARRLTEALNNDCKTCHQIHAGETPHVSGAVTDG